MAAPGAWNPYGTRTATNHLDALVGHANFVAGVIAQAYPGAAKHTGRQPQRRLRRPRPETCSRQFPDRGIGCPLAVAVPPNQADVINVGFAFPTLPEVHLSSKATRHQHRGGPTELDTQGRAQLVTDQDSHVVVVPAGNQGCTTKPSTRPRLVPIRPSRMSSASARLTPAVGRGRDFSNYGPWVACCAGAGTSSRDGSSRAGAGRLR